MKMEHVEYERKFRLEDTQIPLFVERIKSLSPQKVYQTQSTDCYYYKEPTDHIFRYRKSAGKNELTYKSNIAGDFTKRKEVNIMLLDQDQTENIDALMTATAYNKGPVIRKKIEVFDFPDAEERK